MTDPCAAMEKYRLVDGEIGAALVVVGLSQERVEAETRMRDRMIQVAHRCGASQRQLAEVSGLNRKTIAAILNSVPDDAARTHAGR